MDLAERIARSETTPLECWPWYGPLTNDGYGLARIKGKIFRAHRLVYQSLIGPIPDGLYVCHLCDNRACVNPQHLFLGTPLDNMRDKQRKGRAWHPRGEQSSAAKITEDDVRTIRAARFTPISELARRYGISRNQVFTIRRREAWKHVK